MSVVVVLHVMKLYVSCQKVAFIGEKGRLYPTQQQRLWMPEGQLLYKEPRLWRSWVVATVRFLVRFSVGHPWATLSWATEVKNKEFLQVGWLKFYSRQFSSPSPGLWLYLLHRWVRKGWLKFYSRQFSSPSTGLWLYLLHRWVRKGWLKLYSR